MRSLDTHGTNMGVKRANDFFNMKNAFEAHNEVS